MTIDELKDLLRAWGRWYGERPDAEEGEAFNPDVHPLAVAMRFAPGKRSRVLRQRAHLDRSGQGRRRLMAQAAGIEGFRIVPGGYVDAVPCRETRAAVFGGGERSRPAPLALQRVERAALDLLRIDTVLGICLRVHYCTLGELVDKATVAGLRIGHPIPVRAYRLRVSEARCWLLGRLSAHADFTPP